MQVRKEFTEGKVVVRGQQCAVLGKVALGFVQLEKSEPSLGVEQNGFNILL